MPYVMNELTGRCLKKPKTKIWFFLHQHDQAAESLTHSCNKSKWRNRQKNRYPFKFETEYTYCAPTKNVCFTSSATVFWTLCLYVDNVLLPAKIGDTLESVKNKRDKVKWITKTFTVNPSYSSSFSLRNRRQSIHKLQKLV